VGSGLTAADLCVWQIVDLHMRLFKEQMEATVRPGGWGGGFYKGRVGGQGVEGWGGGVEGADGGHGEASVC
jgi:hypothetical protein